MRKKKHGMENHNKWSFMFPIWWPNGPPKKGNYQNYVFTKKELIKYIVLGIGIEVAIGKTFYDSVLACIILLPIIYFYLDQKAKKLQKKRMLSVEEQFRDTILAVSSNLQAGFSVENSFKEAKKDVQMLYGKDAEMVYELQILEQQLNTNQTLENILQDLAQRTQSEDILEFTQIFQIAKRSGGNMGKVITNTANVIKEKMSVRLELETILAEKKLEQGIMKGMPFFIIIYISLAAPNFFDRLYHNLLGIMIMTVCLGLYTVAYVTLDKLLEIEI